MNADERAAREARWRLGDPRICFSCLGDLEPYRDGSSHVWRVRCTLNTGQPIERQCLASGVRCTSCMAAHSGARCFEHPGL